MVKLEKVQKTRDILPLSYKLLNGLYLLCALSVAGESRTISRHIKKAIRSNRGGNCERNNSTKMSRAINHRHLLDVQKKKWFMWGHVNFQQITWHLFWGLSEMAFILPSREGRSLSSSSSSFCVFAVALRLFTLKTLHSPLQFVHTGNGAHKIQTKPR